ncbi:MAG: pyridoxal-phosphate-dependent aminotransferase family protein [Polyangiales bacterium]
MAQPILLNPGPVNTHPAVKAAMAGEDWCHREPEFFVLQDRVRAGIIRALELDASRWTSVLLTGSGTCAVEAMISSLVPKGAGIVVVSNGVYGDRIAKIARAHGIDVTEVISDPSEEPNLEMIEGAIQQAKERGANPKVLAAVHHETTTGLINPIAALGAIAKKHHLTYLLDTVSSLAGESIDLDAAGGDAAACTANKCFEGLPGICFVVARRATIQAVAKDPPRSLYFHLPNYLQKQDEKDTPFTPAVQVMMALDVANQRLIDETVVGRIHRYRGYAKIVRDGVTKLGLRLWLPEAVRSNTITTIALPTGVTYEQLHDAMRAEGFVIYAGQGDLRTKAFRIANMGQIPETELRRAIDVLGRTIR